MVTVESQSGVSLPVNGHGDEEYLFRLEHAKALAVEMKVSSFNSWDAKVI